MSMCLKSMSQKSMCPNGNVSKVKVPKELELAWYISLGGWVIPVGFMTSNWSYFEFSHQIHIDSNFLSQ